MKDRYGVIAFNVPIDNCWTYDISDFDCKIGYRVKANFSGRVITGYVIETHSDDSKIGNFKLKPIKSILDSEPIFFQEQINLANWIKTRYFCSLGEALSIMIPGGVSMQNKILIPEIMDEKIEEIKYELSEEQRSAVECIVNSDETFFYLYGITGSGKTEVFLSCIKKFLEKNRAVIYLVPEISLTHQLINEINGRFKDSVAIIHSKLSPNKKLMYWKKIIAGEINIVVGARSAIFAPVKNLGLIIIDEEHENSYKSGSTPRYHTRQVAMQIAKNSSAKLVMGSATPSVEAYHSMQAGIVKKLELTKRLSGGKIPKFKLIDTKNSKNFLTDKLIEKIKEVKERDGQTILFLNRKGFFHFFHCSKCGFEYNCPNCSVGMVYYKKKNYFKCHFCGHTAQTIDSCPECGSYELFFSKVGTEKLEAEIKKIFPDYKVVRVDADIIKNQKELSSILSDFKAGKTDILLGTQIIAKGLNFPKVKLVGIIDVDSLLNIPDFRASERCFSLITQVAGRAGRFTPDGEVYLQTQKAAFPAIKYSISGEYAEFYESELQLRSMAKFPPFSKIIKLIFRGKNPDEAYTEADKFYRLLLSKKVDSDTIFGPNEAPIFMLNGNFRYQILLKNSNFKFLHTLLTETLNLYKKTNSVYLEIDVEPLNF